MLILFTTFSTLWCYHTRQLSIPDQALLYPFCVGSCKKFPVPCYCKLSDSLFGIERLPLLIDNFDSSFFWCLMEILNCGSNSLKNINRFDCLFSFFFAWSHHLNETTMNWSAFAIMIFNRLIDVEFCHIYQILKQVEKSQFNQDKQGYIWWRRRKHNQSHECLPNMCCRDR